MTYEPTYSLNQYNESGEMTQKQINIHINEQVTIHFETLDEYSEFVSDLVKIEGNIREVLLG